jgi:hypothetical protein
MDKSSSGGDASAELSILMMRCSCRPVACLAPIRHAAVRLQTGRVLVVAGAPPADAELCDPAIGI